MPLRGFRLISFFAALAMLCGAFFNPVQAQTYRFGAVQVQGNDRVDAATIVSYAGIARNATVSAAQLNDAYQKILASGLFEDVSIEPRGNTLVIVVKERPTINVINFEGNRALSADVLRGVVRSQSRRVFSTTQAEADAAALTELYAARGRLAARVTPKIIARPGNRLDLVFEIAEGRVVEVERLSFVGNRAYSDRRLRQVLETRQAGLLRAILSSDTYAADRIETDKRLLTDFYLSRGYVDFQVLDASAQLLPEREGFFVTFTVREGQSYTIGNVTTVSEIPEVDAAEFGRLVTLRSGRTYNPVEIENTVARLEALAGRRGVNFLRVDPRITRDNRNQILDVAFTLVRGPRVFVERIDIEGNTTTLDAVIRRQFRVVEGDPFNPREIRAAAERIRALGFFANASVDAVPGSGPDSVVVKTNVVEQPTGSLGFGATYSVSEGVGFTMTLKEDNFLGRGQAVALSLNLGSNDTGSSFSFSEPALFGRDLRFSFSASYSGTTANFNSYDTRVFVVSPSIEFPVSENGRMALRYTLSNASIFNLRAGSSAVLAAEAATGAPANSALGYTYSWDNRRNGLAGRTTSVFSISQDISGLGGGLQYVATSAKAIAQTRILSDEVVVRAEFEGGAITSLNGQASRITERFQLGGKLRGFEPFGVGPRDLTAANRDALGGNYFAVARFEAEFPLGLPAEYGVRGGIFADIGSVWGLDNTLGGAIDDSLRLRSTIGLSLFWETPLGPLRFNFTRAILKETYDKEQTFDLTISTRF